VKAEAATEKTEVATDYAIYGNVKAEAVTGKTEVASNKTKQRNLGIAENSAFKACPPAATVYTHLCCSVQNVV